MVIVREQSYSDIQTQFVKDRLEETTWAGRGYINKLILFKVILLLRYIDNYDVLSDQDFNPLLFKKIVLKIPSKKYLLKLLLID